MIFPDHQGVLTAYSHYFGLVCRQLTESVLILKCKEKRDNFRRLLPAGRNKADNKRSFGRVRYLEFILSYITVVCQIYNQNF